MIISEQTPNESTLDNRIRADLVRFLALGGDDFTPVHEHGIRLEGAWIDGPLDLAEAQIAARLELRHCRIEALDLSGARLRTLDLAGSLLEKGLSGAGLRSEGDILFKNGFRSEKTVYLTGATITGTLNCHNGAFSDETIAFHGDRLVVSGSIFLRYGFRARGEFRLLGSRISGDLDCIDATFSTPGEVALNCDRAKIGGGVLLRGKFKVSGSVRLLSAGIGGDLDCANATIDETKQAEAINLSRSSIDGSVNMTGSTVEGRIDASHAKIANSMRIQNAALSNPGGKAISIESAIIAGDFVFREMRKLEGDIYLGGTRVGTLIDDLSGWTCAKDKVTLDGFVYSRFSGKSPTDAKRRIEWLMLQRPEHRGESFRSQPWEQLITVLRSMGHPDAARRIAIEKQRALGRAGKIPKWNRPFHWLYGVFAGFGYQPLRIAFSMFIVWLLALCVYAAAVHPSRLGAPPSASLMTSTRSSPDWTCITLRARQGNLMPCSPQTPGTADFFAPAYALDVLLPVVNLGYKSDWKPQLNQHDPLLQMLAWALQVFTWTLTLVGWAFGLLFVGVLGGLIKKD